MIFKTTNRFELIMLLGACLFLAGCNQKSPAGTKTSQAAPVKHYQLRGKIVSVDKQSRMVNIDSEAISGFMDAMTMPYVVKPESELDTLHPGDSITADLMVRDENAWLENITVTVPADASKPH